MSDHDSEVSPTGSGAASEKSASFSKNGSDAGGPAVATAYDPSAQSDGTNFLADLAKAMQENETQ